MINAGSWVCTVEVDNTDLEELINNGTIKGFSLFSYANGQTSYNEVLDKSDVHPLFISFVKYPANQVLFEVLDREAYISKMEAVKMSDSEKSILEKIKQLVNSNEDEIKDDETIVEEPVVEKECGEDETIVEKAENLEDNVVTTEPVTENTEIKEETETTNPNEETTDKEPVVEKADEVEDEVVEPEQPQENVVEKDETGVTNADEKVLSLSDDIKSITSKISVAKEELQKNSVNNRAIIETKIDKIPEKVELSKTEITENIDANAQLLNERFEETIEKIESTNNKTI